MRRRTGERIDWRRWGQLVVLEGPQGGAAGGVQAWRGAGGAGVLGASGASGLGEASSAGPGIAPPLRRTSCPEAGRGPSMAHCCAIPGPADDASAIHYPVSVSSLLVIPAKAG